MHSGQVEVPAKAGRLRIAIAPGVHAARGGNETREELATNVDVPGLNSLKISDVALDIVRDERNEPDQVLLITTSFSVLERELPAKVHAWLLPMRHPDPKLQQPFRGAERRRAVPVEQQQPAAGSACAPTRSCRSRRFPASATTTSCTACATRPIPAATST